LANIVRRQEEKFCIKTYRDFAELHAMLELEMSQRSWGEMGPITRLPELPAKSVPAKGLWGRWVTGSQHNPNLVGELQKFLDSLLAQMPGGDLSASPPLAKFFQMDQVPRSHPLVQQVLKVQGSFPDA